MNKLPKRIIKAVHELLPALPSEAITNTLNSLLMQHYIIETLQTLPSHFEIKAEGDRAISVYLAQQVQYRISETALLSYIPAFKGVPNSKGCQRNRDGDRISILSIGGQTFYAIPSRVGKEVFELMAQQPCTRQQLFDATGISQARATQIIKMMEGMGWVKSRWDGAAKIYHVVPELPALRLINKDGHGFEHLLRETIELLETVETITLKEAALSLDRKKAPVEKVLDQLVGASLITKSGNYYSLHQRTPTYAQAS